MKYRHQGKDNHKKALLKGLALSVIKHGAIETSRTQGKNAQKYLESLVHIAKENNIVSQRRIASMLSINRDLVSDFFKIVPNFKNRVSGFTRIIRLGKRKGDATEMVRLEWVVNVKSTTGIKSKKNKENIIVKGEVTQHVTI